MASAGQAATQSPHLVHRSRSITGTGGPPIRGVNAIAASGQLSPHDWQITPRLARHAAPIAGNEKVRVRPIRKLRRP
jgi:hypothetical protein